MNNHWSITITRDLTGVSCDPAGNQSPTLNYWFRKSVYDTRQRAITAALEDFRLENFKGHIVKIEVGEACY